MSDMEIRDTETTRPPTPPPVNGAQYRRGEPAAQIPRTPRQPTPFTEMMNHQPAPVHPAPPPSHYGNRPGGFMDAAQEPQPMLSVPLLLMIQRVNDYLAKSGPEFQQARQHIMGELEFFMIQANHQVAYEYLEPQSFDTTRRRYKIPHRLMVRSAV